MPPPLFRPRNHLMSSGHPPPPQVGHPHDHSTVPPMPVDHQQHAFVHGMGRGPPNMDRVPYPRGYEGPNSPRSWNPLVSFTFQIQGLMPGGSSYMGSKHFLFLGGGGGKHLPPACPFIFKNDVYTLGFISGS